MMNRCIRDFRLIFGLFRSFSARDVAWCSQERPAGWVMSASVEPTGRPDCHGVPISARITMSKRWKNSRNRWSSRELRGSSALKNLPSAGAAVLTPGMLWCRSSTEMSRRNTTASRTCSDIATSCCKVLSKGLTATITLNNYYTLLYYGQEC